MIIEADLADGAGGRQAVKPPRHGVSSYLWIRLEDLRMMGMDADRKSTFGPRSEHSPRTIDLGVVFRRDNHECARHPCRTRAFNNCR